MTRLSLTAAAFLAMCSPAHAHEWYPPACCSERDCFAISADAVQATADGWRIKETGQVVPYDRARVTPEEGGGMFHVCTPGGMWPGRVLGTSYEQTCFWAPEGGV